MKYSKSIVILCASIAALLFVSASRVEAQIAQIGIRLMPTFSSFDMQLSSDGTAKGNVTIGYGVGAFVGYNFTEHTGLQGEIIYSSLSQKYTEQDVERKVNLKYINIPILFSLNTGKSNPVNFNVVVGPQIGISVGSTVFTSGGTNNDKAILAVKTGDLGFAYGAGLDIGFNPARTFRLGVGFRGVFGLIDVSDNSNTAATNSYYILDRTHIQTYSIYTGLSLLF